MKTPRFPLITLKSPLLAAALIGALAMAAPAVDMPQTAKLTIQVNKPGAKINPNMWGIFFEDINLGADGGLYPELVKNRAFEFTNAMMAWKQIGPDSGGTMTILDQNPLNTVSPHYLRVQSAGTDPFGVSNEGFRGMGIRAGDKYDFSAEVREVDGSPVVRVDVVGADGTVLASGKLENFGPDWKKYSTTLTASATDPKARMNVVLEGKGTLDLDFVSLFPETTFKNRPGGLRADMAQMLADMHPGFLRFPGGCIVEGSQLDRRYQWKTTIGPVEERKLIINRWNYEFAHKPTPDYFQSFGLGFFEYFQLCEDIGASPLPILNCGMACQFNTGQVARMWDLDPYIQDMLDLVEFANGPVTSEWGAKRAAMGHPAPFNLKMIGVGNEQWGGQYLERYEAFVHVMKDKHPEIKLVTDAGPSPSDDRFDFLWPKLVDLHADIVDQHCYARPIWFLNSTHRYDSYDRNGPKIFMGEYAAQSVDIVSTNNRNNLECALAEAAYMTGLERNADVVRMASYAPLFANIDGWQWTPNLIWVDNLRVYGTPNYYVQQLFCKNRGDEVLPVKLDNGIIPAAAPCGGIILSTLGSSAEFKDVQVTRNGETLYSNPLSGNADGWTAAGGRWSVRDGAYGQRDDKAAGSARIGDATWHDYTLTLKARKLGGLEGISVAVRNESLGTQVQWNLGDSGNSRHRLKSFLGVQEQVMENVPGKLVDGQWYDVKMEIKGSRVNCFLDGKRVQSAVVPIPQAQPLYASSSWDESSGEVIIKVINPSAAMHADINLAGVKAVVPQALATVLTGAQADENSLDDPKHIVPVEKPFTLDKPQFSYDFPQYSMTVLRIKAQ